MDIARAEKIALDLFKERDVTPTWQLAWVLDPTYDLGRTDWVSDVISFNQPVIEANDETILREVVNHEFAHTFAGLFADHGPEWQRIARSFGCSLTVETGIMPDGAINRPHGMCPVCDQQRVPAHV